MASDSFDSSGPLKAATVQDIQLELIRRTTHNEMNGERLVRSLVAHRDLWESVILDRMAFSRPGKLPVSGLIKLRDLAYNFWNVDTLYVLTPDAASAKSLAKVAKKDKWGGMLSVHADQEDVDSALGSGREERAVVVVWWD